MKTLPAVLLVASILLAACGGIDHGSPDDDAALPSSIASAVRNAYPGHRVVYSENRPSPAGGPLHRITLDRNGLRTSVLMDDNGTILRERAELREEDTPPTILGTVKKEFPTQDIPLVIRFRENGRIYYEIRLLNPEGLTSSLKITPAGMIIEDIDGEGVPGPVDED